MSARGRPSLSAAASKSCRFSRCASATNCGRRAAIDSAAVTAQNERLAQTLREARDQIMTLKEEVDRLAQPPAGFGTFLSRNDDDSVDVFTGGRKLRVTVSPNVDLDTLTRGQEVMLNEALNVVAALEFEEILGYHLDGDSYVTLAMPGPSGTQRRSKTVALARPPASHITWSP